MNFKLNCYLLLSVFFLGACTASETTADQNSGSMAEPATFEKTIRLDFMPGAMTGLPLQKIIAAGECQIIVDFSSFGTGIPRGHLGAVTSNVEADKRVAAIYSQPWGKEGEITLCLNVPMATDRDGVVDDINTVLHNLGKPRSGSAGPARLISPGDLK